MTEQEITQARYHAACDIAHRWFAFFEGETEAAGLHSALFSEDVMLVHAGTHLLAQGKAEMTRWLRDLPYERGAHFIRRIDVIPLTDDQAEVNMEISYQVLGQEGQVGGALSEYRTTVKFDREHNAVFTFLHKTPRMPNPDKVFRDAFAENRLRSFIARFFQLMLTAPAHIRSLFAGNADADSVRDGMALLEEIIPEDIQLLTADTRALSFSLQVSSNDRRCVLSLLLDEAPGRYMAIRHASLSGHEDKP
ncbi:hypothetical protein HS962_01375 [Pantoea sp. BIGb0393]|uniref:SnoaL-like domain-containing protein n=1 Tax=Pantoea nemavictus TaxID=2726955 RepID=A0ABU8PMA3_9GAMM|nr:hypothetical protein [Pantoea nemavictus]MBA0034893.1 hypothetical protein [Pantoea nemavictus]